MLSSPDLSFNEKSKQVTQKQRDLLQQAKEAAAANDPRKMLEALYQSFVLDSLTRRIVSKWSSLSPEDVELIVAEAIDALYVAISTGKRIDNLIAYLWKVANNKLYDYYRLQQNHRPLTSEDFDQIADHPGELEDELDNGSEDLDWEENRPQVIALVRSLLPRLGQHNVQNVMAYILEAMEKECKGISNMEIAKKLGLSLEVVRQSKHRGFQRLEKIVREQGLATLLSNGI